MRAGAAVAVVLFLLACASGGEPLDTERDRDAAVGPDARPADSGGPADGGPPGDPCTAGEIGVCTTACGTMGTRACVAGSFGPCTPPAEDCNGRDDDCDGTPDDAIPPRMCASGCGGGAETCAAGTWSGCTATMPRAETCDGTDEDCDSRVDEALSRGCTSACGSGTESCSAGAWVGCTAPRPGGESCNGADEDCDGRVDEGLTRGCSTACGSGTETCSAGSFGGCTAPPVRPEACNRADDDCDGVSDEDFVVTIFDPVPMTELRAAQPGCSGPGGGVDVCLTAAHRWCNARMPCHDGGAGFLQATPASARVACFGGGGAAIVEATRAEVSAASGITVDDTNIGNRVAQSASNRFCRSRGSECGVGPVEHGGGTMAILCLTPASCAYTNVSTGELRANACDPILDPNRLECAAAADVLCRSRGHRGGYGPVEWNDTDSAIVCFR